MKKTIILTALLGLFTACSSQTAPVNPPQAAQAPQDCTRPCCTNPCKTATPCTKVCPCHESHTCKTK